MRIPPRLKSLFSLDAITACLVIGLVVFIVCCVAVPLLVMLVWGPHAHS
jgi:hypothetical protein